MSSPFQDIESLYRRALNEIRAEDELCRYLLKIYNELILKISDSSQLQFNTLFARVSYIAAKFHFSKAWTFAFQIPRREIRQRQLTDAQLLPVLKSCIEYLFLLGHDDQAALLPKSIKAPPMPELPFSRKAGRFKKAFARVVIIEWDKEHKVAKVLDEEEPGKTIVVHYNVPGINDIFSETLELALEEIGVPLVLGLTDIDQVDDNEYIPGYIIIMPDLLLDVTAIADYTSNGSDPLAVNLLNQYLPTQSNVTLLIGKVANFFLDELIRDNAMSFQELFTQSFKLFPLEFVRLSDVDMKGLMKQLNGHYDTIRDVIATRFPALGISSDHCVIEPSYFSPQYGIKGRLDLYYQHEEEKTASIIELKSGKPFKPNSYGLSSSNYHQTLLYELLIKAVHGPNHNRANFILYSAMADNPLRYAVSVESIQKETIHNRNQLVVLQFRLINLDKLKARDVLSEIHPDRYEGLKGFLKKDIIEFHEVYSQLSPGEQEYLKAFSAFAAREHMLARIGSESEEGAGGLAGLWLDSLKVKEEGYQILSELQLKEIQKEDHQTILVFQKGERTNPLANFRAGDIAVLYPYSEKGVDPTRYQLHRANILTIDAETVVLRLRNNQVNTKQIESVQHWNIEHDLLDSSFRSLYQSLWLWAKADRDKRNLILGLTHSSAVTETVKQNTPAELTQAQKIIFHEALNAGFLYLLWGPPGTGKTSIMLKHWVAHYFNSTSSRILLLAYTNRAVDEICAALHKLGGGIEDHYIRIGSRAATNESYRHRLIDNVIGPMTRRTEIKKLLDESRVVVGTVASIHGKPELFELLHFDVMIVDEASQLLEPAIIGLLTHTQKVILIGDQMQLPAVSTQPRESVRIQPGTAWAEKIGLSDLSMSYFERLYRYYQQKGWSHLIGSLHEQGRMHQDIMDFVNQNVYKGLLTCIDPVVQQKSLSSIFKDETDQLFHSRLVYVPSLASLQETYSKTNAIEAENVLTIIGYWQALLKRHRLDWTIGVITPFRAQIAAILHLAHQRKVDLKDITVDTVERYQGGARDIIIMSCAVNNPRSLERISSLNTEGIDRKLNVAMTRARQQFVLTGVEAILKQSNAYRQLIESSLIGKEPNNYDSK